MSTLINANVPTRVWEVNLSSFDTHVGEQADQNALLAEVDAALGAFMTSISTGDRSNDVTVMVYSEFGRRVMSNAGLGTDHGTALLRDRQQQHSYFYPIKRSDGEKRILHAEAQVLLDEKTGQPVFLIGNTVKGGLYGEQSSLSALDVNGNLEVTTDFRDVYGGLLHDVLGTPVGDVIPSWSTALSVH